MVRVTPTGHSRSAAMASGRDDLIDWHAPGETCENAPCAKYLLRGLWPGTRPGKIGLMSSGSGRRVALSPQGFCNSAAKRFAPVIGGRRAEVQR